MDDGEESKSANCLAYNIIITVQTLPLHAFETAKKVRQTAKDIIDFSTHSKNHHHVSIIMPSTILTPYYY